MRGAQDAKPQWRDMDAATRAKAYSPSSVLPQGDLMPFIQRYIDLSAQVYRTETVETLRYGPKASNTIDFVRPQKGKTTSATTALHVFIHGGYWQELSKRESMFPATNAMAQGVGFAAVDYTLAPDATLDEIVDECAVAIAYIFENAVQLGVDPERIMISGSSAGAHLAAMVCCKRPPNIQPKAVVLLSGVYDLAPLIGTYINDALGLDAISAHRNSPAAQEIANVPPVLIAWGAQETEEFKRQSRMFAAYLGDVQPQVRQLEVPGRNHFDIVEDLANESVLGREVSDLLGGSGAAL